METVAMKSFATRIIFSIMAVALAAPSFVNAQEAPKKFTKEKIDSGLELLPLKSYKTKAEYDTKKRSVQADLTSLESLTKKVLKGDSEFGPNRDSLDRFLGRYFLPRMTHYDDMSISAGKLRDDLIRNYLNKSYNAQARDHVLDNIIYPFATKVVEGNYHPASRINAMYLIGSLNRREGVRRESLPTLMTQSLTYMIAALDKADMPNYLKVAALHGIARHVGIDQDAQKQINNVTRNSIRDRMLKLVQQPYNGKKNDDDLLYFQQRLATQILGELHDPGSANAVGNQLKSMIANEKLRLWLRVDAVAAFGKINFASDAESEKLIKMMIDDSVKLVAVNARQQSVAIKNDLRIMRENYLVYTGKDLAKIGVEKDENEELRDVSMGTGGDFEFGEGSASNDDDKPKLNLPNYRLNLVRREIKTVGDVVVVSIFGEDMKTVGGLAAKLPAPQQAEVQTIAIQIRKLMRDVDVAMFGDDFDERNRKEQKFKKAITDRLRETLAQSADELEKQVAGGGESGGDPATPPAKSGDTSTKVDPLGKK